MNEPIHILVAHFRSDIVSGAERAIADMVDGMNSRFNITMLIPGEGGLSRFYKQRDFNIWVKRIQTKRRKYPGLHTVQSHLFAKDLREKKVDVVLCNTFSAASRVSTASRLAEIPLAIYVREYISDKRIHRKALDYADKIFAVSRSVREHISVMTDHSKVVFAYDHINADPIMAGVSAHRINGNRLLPYSSKHPVVGLVGRITPYKRQDLFVRAIPFVLSEFPGARFVIVGAAKDNERDYEASVKELTIELGVNDRVVFMGHQMDAVEIMSELAVLCLTSTKEPLGRVILEAQIVGCPVVASDGGGSAEIIENGLSGLLFSSTVPEAEGELALQIIRLLQEDALRNAIVLGAKDRVFKDLASDKPIRRLEYLLEELHLQHVTAQSY